MLVRAGADVRARTAAGFSTVGLAAGEGRTETVRYLLEMGVPVGLPDENGWTPLHSAVNGNHVETVRELLRAGAPVRVKNGNGRTPADLASAKGFREIEQLLMEHGFQGLGL
ncbi:ankyrin repeat protein [Chaetomium sp. MPI-CAGE-AT-0009]|nr:ankyrin repeat protein [Chaetomium sp. MPI-CAGE-AT-0009]